MTVYKISESVAILISQRTFAVNSRFNPVKDKNNNWIITIQELEAIEKDSYSFLNEKDEDGVYLNVEPIEFEPKSSGITLE